MISLTTFPDLLQILTIVVLGVFSLMTLFDRSRKQNTRETIKNLKETIESMKLRMGEMETELEDGKKAHQDSLEKIAHLRGENETLKSLLLGKDPESVEYRKETIRLLREMVRELKAHDEHVRKHLLQ